ncbi:MAG: tRNA (adenine-N1)-methyltransferase [Chloroflexi bacterium]|nr:MAG: tRNA (adenine-N1)-methyltransferase [Chloroflexota bacterium]MBL1196019.1 tRNA (adenine-N1)-methyltransferase [Chloroflexota bacterium]NOH13313.1 tRNA (adenine-N1)-methyltransferase [Chloroflexota bacterium]
MSTQVKTQKLTQYGDIVQLIGPRERDVLIQLEPGKSLHTHAGVLQHDDLVDCVWGNQIKSHLGKTFYILKPALDDLLRNVDRKTQIMYPKDIAYILVTMGISHGARVIEAGTGSGAFTIALAYAVGPEGQIYSYERRPEMQAVARKNLEKIGLDDRVVFRSIDIEDGFEDQDAEALFLDLPNPEDYIPQVRAALEPGGFFGAILPTTNQVERLLLALKANNFAFIEVSEILHRYYKPVASRLRPSDRMNGHTGYLIFARPLTT